MQAKQRLPRPERFETSKVHEDENQHLWAVSYADFLMALLSFFILFFSVDQPARQQLILQLASEFGTQGAAGTGTGAGQGSAERAAAPGRLPATLFDSLSELNVEVQKDRQSLIVNFPDGFFRPGRYDIENRDVLKKFLTIVQPHRDQLTLYFAGHADQRKLKVHRNEVVTNNYILSSLRATSALMIAKDMGFPESGMFVEAKSSNVRNSRSLSIRIEAKGEVQ